MTAERCTECGAEGPTNALGWCPKCDLAAQDNPTYHGVEPMDDKERADKFGRAFREFYGL